MFGPLFSFELKLWFKRPAVYIFFSIFFILAILNVLARAGLLGNSTGDSNANVNSALAIANYISAMNTGLVGLIILITVIAPAVYKDFQYNFHPLLFTKPITKVGYMFGRFSAAYLVMMFIVAGGLTGHMLMTGLLHGDETHKFGPFVIAHYLKPFFLFVVPNTLLVGAIFFSLVTFTRNMIAGYVGCIVLLIFKGVASVMLANLDNQEMAAIFEPFGEQALKYATHFWTPEEQNTLSVPMEGVILFNRLLWLGISLAIAAITYFRFQFSQFNNPVSLFGRKKTGTLSLPSAPLLSLSDMPKVKQDFSLRYSFYQVWFLARFEFRKITRSIFFLIIVCIAIASLMLVVPVGGQIYGTATYPETYQILEVGGILFRFFMNVIIIFYAGVLIWRERDAKVDELTGASPVRLHVSFLSKLTGLILVQALLLLVVMITGMLIQMYYGYYKFELLQYIKELFGLRLIGLAMICALTISLQTLFNNRFVGYIVSIIILALPVAYELLDINIPMIEFDSSGSTLPYSDMNGFGHTVFSFFIYKIYWLGFSVILGVIATLFWVRGKDRGFRGRLRVARASFRKGSRITLAAGFLVFILSGSFIYYNTSILNKSLSSKDEEKQQAEFEKKYKKLSATQQPRIVEANWNVDIFPDKLGATMKGYYILKNKSKRNVDSIIVNMMTLVKINSFSFSRKADAVLTDRQNGFYIYHLAAPLLPGDSLRFDIDLSYFPKGFRKERTSKAVINNGSFFNSGYLPSLGYDPRGELSEDAVRAKYGLPRKPRMAAVSDSIARMNNYISNDADWIRFECVVSTSPDQIAIAPGYLQKEWIKDDRRYFHYKMDSPILNFYAFQSARYEVKRDKWKNVNIEIYYNKGHEYNLDRMIRGVKKSLDYYTANFSPYQHRQVRIVEFPYDLFAQSFPNTIPFSERIGFIARVDDKDPESIDYPFYVTAHEVAHQWWAHQVIGGDVQGSTLMSETMAQYSALMVMEKEYGKEAMKKFLRYEMNKYLTGRAMEGKGELPLMLVENQQYIHYNKGSVIMYALKDYIGEDSLNAAVSRYIRKVAFQEPPYTNSVEFVDYLRAATPDSLKYIIHDMFETITLFENSTVKCSSTKLPDGKYRVRFTVQSRKFRADSVGKSKEIPVADWIDIGVIGKKEVNGKTVDKELYLAKTLINTKTKDFEIIVDEQPVRAGIDPYNKLIDRTPGNNTMSVTGKAEEKAEQGGVTVTVSGKQE